MANRAKYIAKAQCLKREVAVERTLLLLDYFKEHPCSDCGETDPVVLEFDHLRDKAFSIGQKLTQTTRKAIVAEIEKCEVVCANCHRRRTAQRRRVVRARLTDSEKTKDPANRALRLACSRGTDWGKPVLILGYPASSGSHVNWETSYIPGTPRQRAEMGTI